MIYTITLNPAIDYIMRVKNLRFDDINRTEYANFNYGGKGINVSVMLNRLKMDNKALGFIAGFTGKHLLNMLKTEGITCDFIEVPRGETRINVKIKADSELDINAHGPQISKEDITKLFSKMNDLKKGDYLVLAGSVPDNLPADIYKRRMSSLSGKDINFVVDTTGESLLNTLTYRPFLVKPNHHELGDIFGVKTETEDDIVRYAAKMREMGARNVLVSRGDKGAVLLDENGGVASIGTVPGKVISTVGSGDSMVAGFIAGYEKSRDYKYALRLGTACGNATAFSETLAQPDEIKSIFEKMQIKT